MSQFLIKLFVSALIIAAAAEIARRSALVGALIVSLPLTSVLTMIWLWQDGAEPTRIADFAGGILWLILPSLLLFIVTPLMLRHGFGFWNSLVAGCAATAAAYIVTLLALRAWTMPA
jgi:F0F1-type ATP synthase assembly protein I